MPNGSQEVPKWRNTGTEIIQKVANIILCPFLCAGVYFAEPGTGGHKNVMIFLKTIHIISAPMALTLFVFSAHGVTTSAFALFGAFRTSSFGSLPSLLTSVYSLLGHISVLGTLNEHGKNRNPQPTNASVSHSVSQDLSG